MRQGIMMWTVIIAAMALCSGCTTIDPITGEQVRSNSKTLAMAGSIVGSAIGAAVTHDLRGAAIGAAIGGGLGVGTGSYQDRHEAALRQQLRATQIQLQRKGDTVELTLPGDVSFATGSAHVASSFRNSLDRLATVMREYPQTQITITGYTDRVGNFESNQLLSEVRAKAVADYLIGQGVAPARLKVTGMGPRDPIADNHTETGRSQNRRVEISLTPIASVASR